MPRMPSVISICGPSGSGKSQLAKAVAAATGHGRCARIPTDYFLCLPSGMSLHAASPDLRYDWTLLNEVITRPIGTPVTTPDVDFDRLARRTPSGGLPFVVRPLMVTDALAPYPAASLHILLTAPESIRRARVAARDTAWNSQVLDRWASLEDAWEETVAVNPLWDLELDGEEPIARNAGRVAEAWATLNP